MKTEELISESQINPDLASKPPFSTSASKLRRLKQIFPNPTDLAENYELVLNIMGNGLDNRALDMLVAEAKNDVIPADEIEFQLTLIQMDLPPDTDPVIKDNNLRYLLPANVRVVQGAIRHPGSGVRSRMDDITYAIGYDSGKWKVGIGETNQIKRSKFDSSVEALKFLKARLAVLAKQNKES